MRSRYNEKAFTLIELLVVIAIITVLIGILLPSLAHAREISKRAVCASRLSGICKAMMTYAAGNRNSFAAYSSTPTNSATGFKYAARTDSVFTAAVAAEIADSITAPYWAIVRDGSTSPKNFLCPSDPVAREDELQVNYAATHTTDVRYTWDFNTLDAAATVNTISYATMDMYDTMAGANWSPTVGANWVLMGDNNDSDGTSAPGVVAGSLHSYSKTTPGVTAEMIKEYENSSLHRFEGQNFLFGDGHVVFSNDPFVGPFNDNVYSRKTSLTTEVRATTFIHNATAFNNQDVVLTLPKFANISAPSGGSGGSGGGGGGGHHHDRD